jgi:hypothetical protein
VALVVREGLAQLRLGVHHETGRTGPRLADRRPCSIRNSLASGR